MIVCIALGIISIFYGLAVMRVNSGTMFFAVWLVIGAALILLGLGIRAQIFSAIPKAWRIVILILAACCVIVLGITTALIGMHMHDKGGRDTDYIIVLGAQVKAGGTQGEAVPSTVLRYRLDTAYAYLKASPDTVCIASGGKSPAEPEPEADVMKRYLVGRGIDAGRILTEDQSNNTAENMALSRQVLENAVSGSQRESNETLRVGIVTNNFHVFRGTAIAKKTFSAGDDSNEQGKRTQTAYDYEITGIAAPSTPFYLPNNMLRESAGIVKDFLYRNL